MKRSYLVAALAALLVVSGLPGTSARAADKPITLTFTGVFMDKHAAIEGGMKPWAEEINRRTNGRVVIEYYNPNTICAEADIYDSVRSGVVDLGVVNVSRKKGKLPLLEILDLPFLFTSAESGSVAAWRLWKEFPAMQKETDDVHLISLHCGAPSQVQTTGAPAMSDADMAKLKIAAYAPSYADIAKALGASPVTVGPTDIYLSMQRGQTDAVFAPYAYMRSTKVYEAAKHSYEANINCGGMCVVMNKHSWDALPDDVKKVFDELSGEYYARMTGKAIDQSCRDDLEFMKAEGQTVR